MTTVRLPSVYQVDEERHGNPIRQLACAAYSIEADVAGFRSTNVRGRLVQPAAERTSRLLLVDRSTADITDFTHVIFHNGNEPAIAGDSLDLSAGKWLKHPGHMSRPISRPNGVKLLHDVINSWNEAFSYVAETPDQGVVGLRAPQIGAIHAVHAHWSLSNDPATIVMPTGTGKTETMLSVLISAQCRRILVVVPTDALRTQLAGKFISLGFLRAPGCAVLSDTAQFPVVGILKSKPRTVEEVDAIFELCHVVVATSHIAGQCEDDIQARMAHNCSHLFIDEAHHAEAPTWRAFKHKFSERRVLQFTATPFREDGKPLDGKIIYKYPLRKAQDEGYFKPISFRPITEFNLARADRAIAAKAVEQLRADAGRGHILMARVESVRRAEEVFALYDTYREFNPVQIHSGIKSKSERTAIREAIISGKSKIVVCVDMLGEGFDLPELKIAAFHDIRKSLAVTLQLAGRFTRARPDLGNPTFIANVADVNVQEELRRLYTRDPDWNYLLPQLSDSVIAEQMSLKEFVDGFATFPDDVPLNQIRPATSTVIYRTKCDDWTPENFDAGIPGIVSFERIHWDVNHEQRTLVVVAARKVPVVWVASDEIFNWDWSLLVIFWDHEQHLLFINSSSNDGVYRPLACAIAGNDVELIRENAVFRTFAGINRLTLQNVGLTEQLGRLVRYTARMGPDVEPGLSDAQKRNTRRAVLSGRGFEHGKRVTVGASRKGKIWSMRRSHLRGLVEWCKGVGAKVLDDSIDPAEVLKGTLESVAISALPVGVPISIDWPECFYSDPETAVEFLVDGTVVWPLYETDITILRSPSSSAVSFALSSGNARREMCLELQEQNGRMNYRFLITDEGSILLRRGSSEQPLAAFFFDEPPVVWFSHGGSLEGNIYTPLKATYPPYNRDKIVAWDWAGVDLRKETQGLSRDAESIQYRVISELKQRDFRVIVDDDGSGEAADVVAIRINDGASMYRSIDVELYHCKYSLSQPGQRIGDLYEVCGQAQKSIRWMYSHEKQIELFTHLLRRNAGRLERYGIPRLEVGDQESLEAIREMSRGCPVKISIYIVQPGLSKTNATDEQLELLSVTENHLSETYQLPFGVVASS